MSQENTLRMALTALESCSGAPHWDSLQPTVTAIKQALAAQPSVQGGSCGHESCDCRSYCKKQQPASNQELTRQDFGGDCDTPPEPWSAIWVAWNSEDGFTFWDNEQQAILWSADGSNEWPVQYAMQKAPPAPVQEPRARLLKFIGKDTYLEQGHTIARTYRELPKDSYPGAWEEGEKLYTTPPAQPAVPEGWQPIETAPKTSKAILVHCADRKNTFTVTWARDEEFPWSGKWKHFAGDFLTETPTHWMPIPAAPEKHQP